MRASAEAPHGRQTTTLRRGFVPVGAIAVGGCRSRAEPSIRARAGGKDNFGVVRHLKCGVREIGLRRVVERRTTNHWHSLEHPPQTAPALNHPIPSSINHQVDLRTCTYALRGAESASPACSMRSVAAPRLNTPPFVVGVEHDDPAVVGSEKSETHGVHDAGSAFGYFRYRTRAHESAAPPHVTSTCRCNGTDT